MREKTERAFNFTARKGQFPRTLVDASVLIRPTLLVPGPGGRTEQLYATEQVPLVFGQNIPAGSELTLVAFNNVLPKIQRRERVGSRADMQVLLGGLGVAGAAAETALPSVAETEKAFYKLVSAGRIHLRGGEAETGNTSA